MRDVDRAPSSSSLAATVGLAWPLLLSIGLLMAGSGLQGSLLGVRAETAGFDGTVTGAVLGLYYVGYLGGSLGVPAVIRSVGHIRVFAALASLASASVLVHGVWVSPLPWIVLRVTTGVCVAGLFVVSESWLNDVASDGTRATILSIYNTVVTAGLAAGTFLLPSADTDGFVLFVVASVLVSLAAVPVALAPHDAPAPSTEVHRLSLAGLVRAAPLGVAGVAMSGLGTGSALGFGAVYATRAGFGVSGASQFVVAVLAGAVVGQIPLGRWSDRTDRRVVMAVAAVLIAAGAAIGIWATQTDTFVGALLAGLAVGAGSFSLYGLSFAHMADYLAPEAMIAAGARAVVFNGLGAACGPLLVSIVIGRSGPDGLFEVLLVASAAFATYVGYRLVRREAAPEDRRAHYTPVAAAATVAVVDDVVAVLEEDAVGEGPGTAG